MYRKIIYFGVSRTM